MMEYPEVAHTRIRASRIGLGTWAIGGWIGDGSDDDVLVAAIQHAPSISERTSFAPDRGRLRPLPRRSSAERSKGDAIAQFVAKRSRSGRGRKRGFCRVSDDACRSA